MPAEEFKAESYVYILFSFVMFVGNNGLVDDIMMS